MLAGAQVCVHGCAYALSTDGTDVYLPHNVQAWQHCHTLSMENVIAINLISAMPQNLDDMPTHPVKKMYGIAIISICGNVIQFYDMSTDPKENV